MRAQPPGKTYRIAWLSPVANPSNVEALRAGLDELGCTDPTQLVIEPHHPGSASADLARAAAALVRTQPDVIVIDGSAASLAVKRATTSVPIVFVSGDPIATGLVPNLSRPGGNLTGFAVVGRELNVKRLALLRETLPRLARVGVVYETWQERTKIPPLEVQARAVGLDITRLPVRATADLDDAFQQAVKERVGAVPRREKQARAAGRSTPAARDVRESRVSRGGRLDVVRSGRPGDLVEQPTKFHLVVNVDTARALGMSLPPALLLRADRVIDGRR